MLPMLPLWREASGKWCAEALMLWQASFQHCQGLGGEQSSQGVLASLARSSIAGLGADREVPCSFLLSVNCGVTVCFLSFRPLSSVSGPSLHLLIADGSQPR